MKKTLSLLAIAALTVLCFCGCKTKACETTTSEVYITSSIAAEEKDITIKEEVINVPIQTFDSITIETSDEAATVIAQYEEYENILTEYIQEEGLNKNLNNENLQLAIQERTSAQNKIDEYTETYNTLLNQEQQQAYKEKIAQCASEYESATYIWEYFISNGFSEAATAGILGNIMAEVGGQTLYIQYWLESSTYYGMCQWNRGYYPGVIGTGLTGQCDFLLSTIESEFNAYGYLADETYESFKNSTDSGTAALAFAKVYERCGSGSYSIRQSNAYTAYNYFVG